MEFINFALDPKRQAEMVKRIPTDRATRPPSSSFGGRGGGPDHGARQHQASSSG